MILLSFKTARSHKIRHIARRHESNMTRAVPTEENSRVVFDSSHSQPVKMLFKKLILPKFKSRRLDNVPYTGLQ